MSCQVAAVSLHYADNLINDLVDTYIFVIGRIVKASGLVRPFCSWALLIVFYFFCGLLVLWAAALMVRMGVNHIKFVSSVFRSRSWESERTNTACIFFLLRPTRRNYLYYNVSKMRLLLMSHHLVVVSFALSQFLSYLLLSILRLRL